MDTRSVSAVSVLVDGCPGCAGRIRVIGILISRDRASTSVLLVFKLCRIHYMTCT